MEIRTGASGSLALRLRPVDAALLPTPAIPHAVDRRAEPAVRDGRRPMPLDPR